MPHRVDFDAIVDNALKRSSAIGRYCENHEFSILFGYRTPDSGQTIGCNKGFQYRETIDDPTTFYWRICHRLFHFTNQSLFFI